MRRTIDQVSLAVAMVVLVLSVLATMGTKSTVGSAIARLLSVRVIPQDFSARGMDLYVVRDRQSSSLEIVQAGYDFSMLWGGASPPTEILHVTAGAGIWRHPSFWSPWRRTRTMSIFCEPFEGDLDGLREREEMEQLAVAYCQQHYAALGYEFSSLARTQSGDRVTYRGSVTSIAWGGVLHHFITILSAAAVVYFVVFRKVLIRQTTAPHVCARCGYDLSGNRHERCPECGCALPPGQ